jgi:hypothetical protein
MNDREMTKLCAKALYGSTWSEGPVSVFAPEWPTVFDPLHNDAQAMALVKKFKLYLGLNIKKDWHAIGVPSGGRPGVQATNPNLNRAIVECVAKMKASAIRK